MKAIMTKYRGAGNVGYPQATARAVAALRPDLAGDSCIAAVLTADPTLSVEAVIEILDDATADWAGERDSAE